MDNQWALLEVISCVLLVGCLIFGPVEHLEAAAKNYWDVSLGRVNIDDLVGQDNEQFELDAGHQISGAWGGQVGALRAEYRLAFADADVKCYRDPVGNQVGGDGEVRQWNFTLNFFERHQLPPRAWSYRIFWLLGAGVSRLRLNDFSGNGQTLYSGSDSPFIYRAGLGFEFDVTESSYLTIQYTWTVTEKSSFKRIPTDKSVNFDSFKIRQLLFGYRWLY